MIKPRKNPLNPIEVDSAEFDSMILDFARQVVDKVILCFVAKHEKDVNVRLGVEPPAVDKEKLPGVYVYFESCLNPLSEYSSWTLVCVENYGDSKSFIHFPRFIDFDLDDESKKWQKMEVLSRLDFQVCKLLAAMENTAVDTPSTSLESE